MNAKVLEAIIGALAFLVLFYKINAAYRRINDLDDASALGSLKSDLEHLRAVIYACHCSPPTLLWKMRETWAVLERVAVESVVKELESHSSPCGAAPGVE